MKAFDFSQITEVQLASGSHSSPEQGMCFMEMTAWFAGEPHSDKPQCACPILGQYGIALNDYMPDEMRDRLLKPLVPLIAGTRGSPADELARARFLAMWGINKLAPIWLRAYGIPQFDALASLCEEARSDDDLRKVAARAARADLADLADLAARAARAARAALAALADLADLADLAARAALAALAALADLADLADLAARAALAADQILELMVDGLRQAILIGPHEGFDIAIDLAVRHRALRELVEA